MSIFYFVIWIFKMIFFCNFVLCCGEWLLLFNVDLILYVGYCVGVVGCNGVGKFSLFVVVKGELEVDKGDVDLFGKVCIVLVV